MYKIQGNIAEFETGTTRDNRQVVLGLLCPYLVAFFFSPEGDLLGREDRLWNYPAPRQGETGPYDIYDKEFERHLKEQFASWKQNLGFVPQTITVKPFFDDERTVGVQSMEDYIMDYYDGDEDTEERDEELAAFEGSGQFVFYWAKNYILAEDGKVVST